MESCVLRQDYAVAPVAKPFAVVTLQSESLDDRREPDNSFVDRETRRVEAVKARAVVGRSEIERILTRRLAHETDLGEIGTGAAVGTTGNTQADGIVLEASLVKNGFKLGQNIRQPAFTLCKGETTRRERYARQRVET